MTIPHEHESVHDEALNELHIQRFPNHRPYSSSKAVQGLKRALQSNNRVTLDEDAIEVVAGLFADPARIARIAGCDRNGVDGLAQVKSAHTELYIIEGEVDFSRLVPLVNPRLGHLNDNLVRSLQGALTADATQLAQAEIRFADPTEAKHLIGETSVRTLEQKGADYSESILTHEIMTPIEVVLVRVLFDDDTPSVVVPMPFDGISRTVSTQKVALGGKPGNQGAGLTDKLREEFQRRLGVESAKAVKRFRSAVQSYNAELDRRGVTMSVLRTARSLTVPVRLIVGGDFLTDSPEALPSAIATLQSARHISINPWHDSAEDAMAAHRMVVNLANNHHVGSTLLNLVDNRADREDAVRQFGPDADLVLGEHGWVSPLWRAVALIHTLTRTTPFKEGKRFIRSDLGIQRVGKDKFGGILGVLVDLPWRSSKPATLSSARKAWRNFGVLTNEVWDNWTPIVAKPEELATRALEGDHDARMTLLVAAGTAVIADGILTRDTGSKADDGRTDYRATPNVLLSNLLNEEHGIRQAATIVSHFDPDSQGGDGGDSRETYIYPLVHPSGQHVIDGTVSKAVKEGDLFRQADPERAEEEESERRKRQQQDRPQKISPEQRNGYRRSALGRHLQKAQDTVSSLCNEIAEFGSGKLRQHPFGTPEEWKALQVRTRELNENLLTSSPPPVPVDAESSGEREDDDEGEDTAVA